MKGVDKCSVGTDPRIDPSVYSTPLTPTNSCYHPLLSVLISVKVIGPFFLQLFKS